MATDELDEILWTFEHGRKEELDSANGIAPEHRTARKEAKTKLEQLIADRVREALEEVIIQQIKLAGGVNAYTNIIAGKLATLTNKQEEKK